MHARLALLWFLIAEVMQPITWAGARPASAATPVRDHAGAYTVKVWIEATEPGSDLVRWLKNDSIFRPNDEVVLRVKATKPVYVYVFTQTGADAATLQAQETSAGAGLLHAGETLRFPARTGVYRIDQAAAQEHFKIVALRRPLDAESAKLLGLPWPPIPKEHTTRIPKSAPALHELASAAAEEEKKEEKKDEKKDTKCADRPGEKGRPPHCRRIQPIRNLPDREPTIAQPAGSDGTAVVNLRLKPPVTDDEAPTAAAKK